MVSIESLSFLTVSTTFVRNGFPRTRRPYQRIVGMATGEEGLVCTRHPFMDPPRVRVLDGPLSYTRSLRAYYKECYDSDDGTRRVRTCADFACRMAGIVVPNWMEAFKALDLSITPENSWGEGPLPLGAIGVVAALKKNEADPYEFTARVMHAIVGTGESEVLHVSGLGGYMGFIDQGEAIAYTIQQANTWGTFAEGEIQLYADLRNAH